MFRLVIALVVVLITVPAYGQTVFIPSRIDFEQNERLDKLEKEVERLDILDSEIFDIKESQTEIIRKIDKLIEKPVKPLTVVQSTAKPIIVQQLTVSQNNGLYSVSELRSIYYGEWPNGYRVRVAEVSPRSQVWNHLVSDAHSFQLSQVQGLTMEEALGIHDLYHAGLIRAQRGSYRGRSIVTQPSRSPSPQKTYNTLAPVFNSGCANGQCARQRTTSSSKSTGWYLGKNLGR